ncbi:hypothetical protein BIWAKO_06462 [Bosea sp. BIWAKO-01]|nr:hypothetical protein BIWAKO_06462 [Bosea sp. BIWAKO-01]
MPNGDTQEGPGHNRLASQRAAAPTSTPKTGDAAAPGVVIAREICAT